MSHLPSVFKRPITGGAQCGSSIILNGKVNNDTNRFDVELKSDVGVPLHCSFRFSEGCVVRNHLQPGSWGKEEKYGRMPLCRGQNFSIQFFFLPHAIFPSVIKKPINGGAQCDTSVIVNGMVYTDTNRFDIELKSYNGVPLHCSFRFSEGCVVRNHLQPGSWGKEEKEGGMPLCRGQHFSIQFKFLSDVIFVGVNGGEFCNFRHRLPLSSISSVAVYGKVHIIGCLVGVKDL